MKIGKIALSAIMLASFGYGAMCDEECFVQCAQKGATSKECIDACCHSVSGSSPEPVQRELQRQTQMQEELNKMIKMQNSNVENRRILVPMDEMLQKYGK